MGMGRRGSAAAGYKKGQLRVSDFDYQLPEGLIAQVPAEPRDSARLMVYDRASGVNQHRRFRELTDCLQRNDLLVVNDTRVLPHRLRGRRSSGGSVECLILDRHGLDCRGYVKPARKIRPGETIVMEGGRLALTPLQDLGSGLLQFRLEPTRGTLDETLEEVGRAPLPPYIRRDGKEGPGPDRGAYQTVYAEVPGAVAAPTAGLHFTTELLDALGALGVRVARVTLHVGEGTFAPVRVEQVEEHRMHKEAFVLSGETAEQVARARTDGGRVIAVGTTAARTLETCARSNRTVRAQTGTSELFLYPGKSFQIVDGLITNFHLPRSTLLMLVCAFVGTERVLELYREAVEREYRFYSYGDAMLIL